MKTTDLEGSQGTFLSFKCFLSVLDILRFLYHAMDDFWADCFEEEVTKNAAGLASLQYSVIIVMISMFKVFA